MSPTDSAVVVIAAPGSVSLEPAPPLPLGPAQARVRTLYSGISAGTELTTYRGSNPYLHRHWDPQRRLFTDGPASAPYPASGFGYEEVGAVVEVGSEAQGVRVGDIVWGIWGHRSEGVLPAGQLESQVLPAGAPPVVGIFARPGAVALNAVVDADIHVGETVAIFGQGVIGLLATALAKLNGATVIAADMRSERLAVARRLGADHVVDVRRQSAAEVVRELTEGRGADVCIEFSGSYQGLQEAIRTCAYSSRVVAAGFYQGAASALQLGEEFHHNRIEVVSSQISGPPPRHAHRWTRERLHRSFMHIVTEGRLDPRPLVTDVVAAQDVAKAFEVLDADEPGTLQVVLDFGGGPIAGSTTGEEGE